MPDGHTGMPDDYADWPEFDAHLDQVRLSLASVAREALTPDPPFDLLEWTIDNRVFDDMTSDPGPYDPTTAPYCNKMLEGLSPGSGVEEMTIIKCAQSGGSVVLESFMAGLLSNVSATAMLVHPTIRAFEDWAEEKWWPMVHATDCLNPDKGGSVIDRQDKKTGGSTGKRVRFANGSWMVGAGSNSAATLRQKSIRYMALDDLDGFEENASKEGDPENLAHQRTKTFRRRGMAVTLRVSTPLLEGSSRIMRHYQRSDRRRFYHRCKNAACRALTDFDWEDVIHAERPPYGAHVICPACETVHRHGDKRQMQIDGAWVPTAELDGEHDADGVVVAPPKTIPPADEARWIGRDMKHLAAHRGYWITGVMNFSETWDSIAEGERLAGSDLEALKVFNNTVLGRTFKIVSKTPDWEALSARRSDEFRRGEGAYGPSVFTLSADVQGYGIYWLAKGYNANEESWYLDWGLVPGETAVIGEGVWPEFDKIAERGAPLPGGKRIAYDIEVIDSNFNTPAVKAWVRRRPRAIAINGEPGWNRDIISRTVQSDLGGTGKRKKFGLRVWHVGTYPAKAVIVARYGKTVSPRALDETGVPRGYCWFPANADEPFFRQLTSEYLEDEVIKTTGLIRKTWKKKTGAENHLFDCDVYGFAGLAKIGARAGTRGSWTAEDWAACEDRVRNILDQAQADLFDRRTGQLPALTERRSPGEGDTAKLPSALERMARLNRQN